MLKLPFPFRQDTSPRAFLGIDLGTEYIKVLSFEITPDKKAVIAGCGEALITDTGPEAALGRAITEAGGLAGGSVREAIIGARSEDTLEVSVTVRHRREDPQKKIDQPEIDQLLDRVNEVAIIEAAKQYARRTGNPDLELELINSTMILLKMDDLKVDSPLGCQGRQLEVTVTSAFAPSAVIKSIQKLCRSQKLNLATIVSSTHALTAALGADSRENFNALLVDVGGQVTKVGIVFGGGVHSSGYLSFGGQHFTQALVQAVGWSPGEAEEKLRGFLGAQLSEADQELVEESLKKPAELWFSAWETVLSSFEGVKTFPNQIYLVGGGSRLPSVMTLLAGSEWWKAYPFREEPEVERVTLGKIPQVEDRTGRADSVEYTPAASLGVVGLELWGLQP